MVPIWRQPRMLGTDFLGKVSFLRNCPFGFLNISTFSLPHTVRAECMRTTAEWWCGCLEESLMLWCVTYICCDSTHHLFMYWTWRAVSRIQVQHLWVLPGSCIGIAGGKCKQWLFTDPPLVWDTLYVRCPLTGLGDLAVPLPVDSCVGRQHLARLRSTRERLSAARSGLLTLPLPRTCG